MEKHQEANSKVCARCKNKYEKHELLGNSRWCISCAGLRIARFFTGSRTEFVHVGVETSTDAEK